MCEINPFIATRHLFFLLSTAPTGPGYQHCTVGRYKRPHYSELLKRSMLYLVSLLATHSNYYLHLLRVELAVKLPPYCVYCHTLLRFEKSFEFYCLRWVLVLESVSDDSGWGWRLELQTKVKRRFAKISQWLKAPTSTINSLLPVGRYINMDPTLT